MMRRELVQKLGGYRQLFWEEYDLYLRYAQATHKPFFHLPEPLYNYSRHAGSLTADPDAADAGWRELRRTWGMATLAQFGSHPALDD